MLTELIGMAECYKIAKRHLQEVQDGTRPYIDNDVLYAVFGVDKARKESKRES
jgi:hypothetical protein